MTYKIIHHEKIFTPSFFSTVFCHDFKANAQAIYQYTTDITGAPAFVATGLTAANLTKIGGGVNTACMTGFSGFTVPVTYTSYSTSDPAINVDLTPSVGYTLTVTSVSVGIRRSGTGPNNCRLAYSIDGGTTWVDKGSDDFPNNAGCGSMTTASWTFPCAGGVIVGNPGYLKFRLFYFNAGGSSGTTQVMNLTMNGTVTNVCTPPTASISGSTSFCTSGSTTITFTGTPNATVTYNINNGPNQTIVLNCAGTATLSTGVLNATTIYSLVSASFGNACSQTISGTATVTVTVPPTITVTFTNPTTCNGTNGTITISGLTTGTSYTVHYTKNAAPQTLTATAVAGAIVVTGLSAGSYTSIFVTINSCNSNTIAGPITLVDPTPPTINISGTTNPTTCSGTNGSITIAGLVTGNTYTVNYLKNAVPQTLTATAAANAIIITGLSAGSYTNFSVTIINCTSNILAGPYVLTDPPAPTITSTSFTNPTTCGGTNGTITLHGLLASTAYTLNYSLNNIAQGPIAVTSDALGDVLIANLVAGTYSNISVTRSNCISNIAGPITLTSPVPPAISSISFTDPTTCGGTNGTITLNGLLANTSFSLYYTNITGPIGPLAVSSNASGQVIISNLPAGVYSNIYLVWLSCTSNIVGPITLTAPTPPVITSVTPSNPVTCSGANGSIVLSGLLANTSYTVNYSFNATPQSVTVVSDASGNITINGLSAGSYTNISVSWLNCNSNIFSGPYVLTDPAPPVIAGTSFANPTTCSGTDGAITLSGLGVNITYTLNYTKNGVPQGPVTATTNILGTLQINNLSGGLYANINVTFANCVSNTVGPITLTDPTPPVITGTTSTNPTSCSGTQGSITLSGLQANTAYVLNYDMNAAPQGPLTVTSNASGDIIISNLSAGVYGNITVTKSACLSNVAGPVTLTDPAPPAPPIANGLNYCQYAIAAQLTATGSNLLWYTTPIGGVGNPVAPIPSTATPGTTSYYVSQTVNNCESQRAVLDITVFPKPAAPVVTTPVTYCQGEAAVPLTATGLNLLWYSTPTGGTGNPVAPIPSTATASSTDYYVSQSVTGCESDRSLITVIVGPTPQPPVVISPVTYCQFETPSQTLDNYVTGTNILWYATATGGAGTAVAPVVNTGNTGSTTYYVSQALGNCESGRSPLTVTINPQPVPPTTTDAVYCQFETAVPLTAAGQNLLWYSTATGGTGLPSMVPATSAAGVFSYYVTQTVTGCESNRASLTVTVKQKPPVPTTNISSYTYCQFETGATTLSATGSNLQWYTQATGGNPSNTAPTPTTNTAGITTWYVTQTVNGCESDRLPIVVTVNTKPQPPVVVDLKYCQGDVALPLTAVGQNLKWYATSTGGTAAPNAPTPATTLPDTITWYVSQTLNGCESDRAAITYIIYLKPDATIKASKDTACQHDTLSFSYIGNGAPGFTYNWSVPAGAAIVSGTGQGPIQVQFNGSGVYNISLIVDNNGCQSPQTNYKVYIRSAPEVTLSSSRAACPGDTVNIATNYINGAIQNYLWDFDGGHIVIIKKQRVEGPYLIKWANAGMHIVSLKVTDGICASPTALDSINIYPAPEAKIIALSRDNICAGDTVTVSASTNDPLNKYWWYPEQYFDNGNGNPVASGMIDYTSYVRLQVTSPFGCIATDSVLVTAPSCCHIEFPTAFSPNGDGKNDLFRPITTIHQQVSYFRVLNRWGNIVYESLNQLSGWNGSVNGVAQDIGTYYYQVKYSCDGKMFEENGDFTLLR